MMSHENAIPVTHGSKESALSPEDRRLWAERGVFGKTAVELKKSAKSRLLDILEGGDYKLNHIIPFVLKRFPDFSQDPQLIHQAEDYLLGMEGYDASYGMAKVIEAFPSLAEDSEIQRICEIAVNLSLDKGEHEDAIALVARVPAIDSRTDMRGAMKAVKMKGADPSHLTH